MCYNAFIIPYHSVMTSAALIPIQRGKPIPKVSFSPTLPITRSPSSKRMWCLLQSSQRVHQCFTLKLWHASSNVAA